MNVSAYEIANRFNKSLKEVRGEKDNPLILYMLRLAAGSEWPQHDEVPWCSAFVFFVAHLLDLNRPRTKRLRARSWLRVGQSVDLEDARVGNDVAILKRGTGPQPGPEVIDAIGHCGFFAGVDNDYVYLLGGNQQNEVNISLYNKDRVLGISRLEKRTSLIN